MAEKIYTDFCNTLYALVSNNLFIAICSAWLTNSLSNLSTSYKEYLKNIQKRLFFINNVLFIINQNYLWTIHLQNGHINTDEWYKHIKHINLVEIDYNSDLDKLLIKFINLYESILTNTYILLSSDKTPKDADTFKDFEEATNVAKDSCQIIVNIYENTIEHSKELFLRNLLNLQSQEQIEQKNQLKQIIKQHE